MANPGFHSLSCCINEIPQHEISLKHSTLPSPAGMKFLNHSVRSSILWVQVRCAEGYMLLLVFFKTVPVLRQRLENDQEKIPELRGYG